MGRTRTAVVQNTDESPPRAPTPESPDAPGRIEAPFDSFADEVPNPPRPRPHPPRRRGPTPTTRSNDPRPRISCAPPVIPNAVRNPKPSMAATPERVTNLNSSIDVQYRALAQAPPQVVVKCPELLQKAACRRV